jgi:large subunit ribosomal protein L13
MRSTYITKPADAAKDRKWFVVDAEGQTLGRLASEVAVLLRGKHKPTFSPSVDTGDYVIVVNAAKVAVTGKKLDQKVYRSHSGYIGKLKEVPLKIMLAKKPGRVIWLAVRGMLPKNNLGRAMLKKLKVYEGAEHKQQAQQPEVYTLKG